MARHKVWQTVIWPQHGRPEEEEGDGPFGTTGERLKCLSAGCWPTLERRVRLQQSLSTVDKDRQACVRTPLEAVMEGPMKAFCSMPALGPR
eukprot:6194231-Pleurochrysis_carterae.AAC.2